MPAETASRNARSAQREHVLTVRSAGDALTADWDQGDPFPLALPLAKKDLDELAWYLERYIEFPGAGDRARAAGLERRLADWGLDLWRALFPGAEENGVYAAIRDHLDQCGPGSGQVLLTLASDQPEILIRPWEMLRDPRGPLALRGLRLRRRLLQSNTATGAPPAALPLRLLLIVSRPADTGFIDPRTSTRPVLDALAQLGDQVQVDFCEPPTVTELERRLAAARAARAPYQIVHFDGHGDYDPETAAGVLCFERYDGKTALVEGRELGALLTRFQVPLVLLETCRGAQVSDRPVFGAVAPALLQSGVGSVIAFSHAVHVAAAQMVSERFYRALAGGATVGESLQAARAALYKDRRRWLALGPDPETLELQDWIIPQLYQTGEDPALVPGAGSSVGRGKERTSRSPWRAIRRLLGLAPRPNLRGSGAPQESGRAAPPPLPGFPPAPRYGFQGRAREILVLERVLRDHSGVLLHAGGGMGKTALAREAAHWWLRTGRFERALFHSFEQGAGAEAVVRLIGESLGGEGFLRLSPEEQWAESVRLFRQSRALLVWDNFESVLPAFANPVGSAARIDPGTGDPGAGKGPHSGPYSDATGANPAGANPVGSAARTEGGADAGYAPFDAAARVDLERLYRELTDAQGPTTPRGRLLVTCRPGESGLAGIRALRLGGLARPDALHLLRGIVERGGIDLERDGYEREEIDALLDRLEDHPLSIELVGPHLKGLTPQTLRDELAQRLEQFQDPDHGEGRNRSLLASLEFSLCRLSPAAREALPWLGWFEGGVFERFFLDFARISTAAWSPIRAELTATALLRVEDLDWINTPYLKIHPTLADALPADCADGGTAKRFITVYIKVNGAITQLLQGSWPATGLALAAQEQFNLYRAMGLAFREGQYREGAGLGMTLGFYLERVGRLRERNRLAACIREQMPADRLDRPICAATCQHAWGLFAEGRHQEALTLVQALEARITAGTLTAGNPDLELALTRCNLGQMLDRAGHTDLAIEPLQQAITVFRSMGDSERRNLSATLGSLANALRFLGEYDRALNAAEEGLALDRALGSTGNIAIALVQIADILRDAGRHGESESRYDQAREAAKATKDLHLQRKILEGRGILQQRTGRAAESDATLHRLLRDFQQSGDRGGEMRITNQLGEFERDLGRLDSAEVWCRRAIALAESLGDRFQIGSSRQNLGIILQLRAECASNQAERRQLLAEAVTEMTSSLDVWHGLSDRLGEALARSQLGTLYLDLGDLDRAEAELQQALVILVPLSYANTWKVYAVLVEIARARHDTPAATDWQAKADAKRAEAERLAAGPTGGAARGPAAAPDR